MGRKITKLPQPAQLPTRLRVAAYARVSCGKDEMLHSLAAQVSFYSNLIQSKPAKHSNYCCKAKNKKPESTLNTALSGKLQTIC